MTTKSTKPRKSAQPITQARLKEILCYIPETGVFIWLESLSNRVTAGAIAGSINSNDYSQIKIDGRNYKAHRLAFLFMTGRFPQDQVDHIDGDRANNRWSNLRECTPAENQQNRISRPDCSSKFVGVTFHKAKGKWQAYIQVDGKRKHLSYFTTESDAHAAYLAAKADLHTFNPIPRVEKKRELD